MAEHSPLPWRWSDDERIIGADGFDVLAAWSEGQPGLSIEKADRDLILKAVNHHAELVGALKEAVRNSIPEAVPLARAILTKLEQP